MDDLGLWDALLRAVREQGFAIPTPIQTQAIPAILSGRDVMAAAHTGAGKSAAFTLPMLQSLMGVRSGSSRSVREVVHHRHPRARRTRANGAHLPFQGSVVYGRVGMQLQVEALRRGIDIVVAMTGRILDHPGRGRIDLSKVEIFILDGADRMLDMGFIRDVRRALALMPARQQNRLFGAIFADEVKVLIGQLLECPELIEPGRPNSTPATIGQSVYRADGERKTELQVAHNAG